MQEAINRRDAVVKLKINATAPRTASKTTRAEVAIVATAAACRRRVAAQAVVAAMKQYDPLNREAKVLGTAAGTAATALRKAQEAVNKRTTKARVLKLQVAAYQARSTAELAEHAKAAAAPFLRSLTQALAVRNSAAPVNLDS
jgi:phage host-nuclease inhibitor protein Gam